MFKRYGKIWLFLDHNLGGGLEFIVMCIDYSDKDAVSTFGVETQVTGYLRSHCGSTPSCAGGYYSVISGET